jgi:hypothetical protein
MHRMRWEKCTEPVTQRWPEITTPAEHECRHIDISEEADGRGGMAALREPLMISKPCKYVKLCIF